MRLVYDTGHRYHRSAGYLDGRLHTRCDSSRWAQPRRPGPGEIRVRRLVPCLVCYPRKRAPLPRLGRIGREREATMRKLRPQLRARDQVCQGPARGVPGSCWGPLDPHHVRPRRGPADDVLGNLVLLCRGHHEWAEEHPVEAATLGLHEANTGTGHGTGVR